MWWCSSRITATDRRSLAGTWVVVTATKGHHGVFSSWVMGTLWPLIKPGCVRALSLSLGTLFVKRCTFCRGNDSPKSPFCAIGWTHHSIISHTSTFESIILKLMKTSLQINISHFVSERRMETSAFYGSQISGLQQWFSKALIGFSGLMIMITNRHSLSICLDSGPSTESSWDQCAHYHSSLLWATWDHDNFFHIGTGREIRALV